MKPEISAGILIFRKTDKGREYLLLHYPSLKEGKDYWEFPKGHLEGKEKPEEAAIRELEEETGLKIKKLIPGFKKKIKYFFRKDNQIIFKIVYYFLAETEDKKVKISSEHLGFQWLNPDKAKKLVKFKNSRQLIEEAESFLAAVK
ncbi:MAG TPA: NUDIX domain-containing protein [Candidatus Paceibacterota bacterium]|nr:NUDIX domain-containing protein [Candidatus Paceibacterota bacterium]